jgi:predicted helicase
MQFKTIQEFTRFLIEEANKIENSLSGELERTGILEFVNNIRESEFEGVLEGFKSNKNGNSVLIHLYEEVLKEYDPKRKLRRGVFYTPDEIVSFIVRGADHLLRTELERSSGLIDDVSVLDPATGTGTFLVKVISEMKKNFDVKHKSLSVVELKKKWCEFISNFLLSRLRGWEIMEIPYAISLLNLRLKLRETGCELGLSDKLRISLASALDGNYLEKCTSTPLIVVGNPPYSVSSQNKGKWIDDLMKKGYERPDRNRDFGYYSLDRKPLGEKSVKALGDDYVKFVRFAQWKVDIAGEGLIGFVTNSSYIDNPTFRGMRQSLLSSFNRIYVLNLHGSAIKDEISPDGTADENVFDIKQGVAITFFVKTEKYDDAKVFYADLYGTRDKKLKWLEANDFNSVEWRETNPKRPYYYFVPKDYSLDDEYASFWSLTDIFLKPYYCQGIITSRDHLTIKNTPVEVWQTVKEFATMDPREAHDHFKLRRDSKSWQVEDAQRDLVESDLTKKKIVPILYRPFDVRYTYYTGRTCGFHFRPRREVMQHMLANDNIGLLACRQQRKIGFYHAFASKHIVDCCVVSNKTREGNFLFPLYYYSDGRKNTTINPKVFNRLSELYGLEIPPEDVFYYIYGMLYSNKYREKYAEYLRFDFPRIPFVKEYLAFKKVSEIGKKLVGLHLTKNELVSNVKLLGSGSSVIKCVKFAEDRIYINKNRYLEPIFREVWNFKIGCYQILKKYLSERIRSRFENKDVARFATIVEKIKITIANVKTLDPILSSFFV